MNHTEPSPGLGLELGLLDLAPWSLCCLSAQSDGCIDDSKRSCHPMSFLVLSSAHPYGTLFSNVSHRVLKAETAGSNCFCWFLATYLVAICSKKCDFSIYSFEKWQKTKTGCCFVDHELTPIYPPGTPQTECSSEGLSIK